MKFTINIDLLLQSRESLSGRKNLYWIVGGSGSGKTTICNALSEKLDIPIYDMDAHIYGDYHGRFTEETHPINKAWVNAENSLAWLLNMTWEEFNAFNQAALPEYLHLLSEDMEKRSSNRPILIDGGISNPALLAEAISPQQIICLARPGHTSAEVWTESEERRSMQDFVFQLPEPEKAWHNFLEFDKMITITMSKEAQEKNIVVLPRKEKDSVSKFAKEVAQALQLAQ